MASSHASGVFSASFLPCHSSGSLSFDGFRLSFVAPSGFVVFSRGCFDAARIFVQLVDSVRSICANTPVEKIVQLKNRGIIDDLIISV